MSKLEQLKAGLIDQVAHFEKESKDHKNLHRRLRCLVFGMAAISTVLGSIALSFPKLQKPMNLAIVLVSASGGVITSYEGLRKPAELWIHERTTYYALKDLAREVEYYISGGAPDTKVIDGYFERFQATLGSSGEKWIRQIQPVKTPVPVVAPQPTAPRPLGSDKPAAEA